MAEGVDWNKKKNQNHNKLLDVKTEGPSLPFLPKILKGGIKKRKGLR